MCASMSPRVSSTHSTSDARSDAHSSSARNSSHCARTIVSTASGTRTSRSVRSIVVASKSQTCSRAIFDGVAKNARSSPIVASMRRTRVRRERSADQVGRGLHTLIPHGASDDLRRIGAVAVLIGDVANLLEVAFVQRRGIQSERDEAIAVDVEFVLYRLFARVRQVRDLGAGLLGDQFGEFDHAIGLGNLVEDADLLAATRRVLQRDLNAPN